MSQRSVSFENVDCMAKRPVAAHVGCGRLLKSIQAHLSPFSDPPKLSVHPPIGIWSAPGVLGVISWLLDDAVAVVGSRRVHVSLPAAPSNVHHVGTRLEVMSLAAEVLSSLECHAQKSPRGSRRQVAGSSPGADKDDANAHTGCSPRQSQAEVSRGAHRLRPRSLERCVVRLSGVVVPTPGRARCR